MSIYSEAKSLSGARGNFNLKKEVKKTEPRFAKYTLEQLYTAQKNLQDLGTDGEYSLSIRMLKAIERELHYRKSVGENLKEAQRNVGLVNLSAVFGGL
ncbi:MAG: hypothetical protein M0P71_01765 [Melioribacteraceae bacterium]|nr:hypothetical protein [Melioribacteraceae bacterium]